MGIPDQCGRAPAGIHAIGPPAAAVLLGEVCIHSALMPTLSFGQLCTEMSPPSHPFLPGSSKSLFSPVNLSVSLTAAISSASWEQREQREQLRTALSAGW